MKRVRPEDIYNFWETGLSERANEIVEFALESFNQEDKEVIIDEDDLIGYLADYINDDIEREIYEELPEMVLRQFGKEFILEKEGEEIEVNENNVYEIIPDIVKNSIREKFASQKESKEYCISYPIWCLSENIAKGIVLANKELDNSLLEIVKKERTKGPRI